MKLIPIELLVREAPEATCLLSLACLVGLGHSFGDPGQVLVPRLHIHPHQGEYPVQWGQDLFGYVIGAIDAQ